MKTREALEELEPGQCYIMSPPRIDMMFTAVLDARISKEGEIKLVYYGGKEERGKASEAILDTEMDDQSLLTWTSCVQSQRP